MSSKDDEYDYLFKAQGQVGASEEETGPLVDAGLLIETIKHYEFIYNVNHREYKNKEKKELAWREIAEMLNVEVDVAMKAWRNLRDRFVKEKNKSRGSTESVECTWPFFNAMLFYAKYTKRRRKYCMSVPYTKKLKIQVEEEQKTVKDEQSRPSSSASCSSYILSSPSTPVSTNIPEIETLETPPLSLKGKGKKRSQEVVMEIASTSTQYRCVNTNRSCVEYIYSRLEEMNSDEAKEKRKKLLFILEDIDLAY